ncbi:nucleoside diphosphate kinase regulator [Ensifer sp. ENS10]|uniref:nucleoside diphosphate kinase regulator n=1 Tax=unclassified Ensifer TaxID=2633371 RepID=UPI000708D100|nr:MULTISPECIES: nucleoside diphosphate kinase regulator [unclassified Ensifer]KRD72975.1 nucleoside diphosphate kinase regulator [Ensifer sp. Root278]MBD9505312.1 nucleoside diphosphate kinase regulator [Ensifer sp. ENS10]MBV7516850.1 nucleoside diphosphate kinase regulator [Ensifer sp. ENS12]
MAASRKKLPPIIINADDHKRLTALASSALDRVPDVAEALLSELDRARIGAPEALPADSVQMGSSVAFEADNGFAKQVTLVYPGEADIETGRISVLTPVGAALIGLSVGQSIDWQDRSGKVHRMTIRSVTPQAIPGKV